METLLKKIADCNEMEFQIICEAMAEKEEREGWDVFRRSSSKFDIDEIINRLDDARFFLITVKQRLSR
jgi:hypothetical protein